MCRACVLELPARRLAPLSAVFANACTPPTVGSWNGYQEPLRGATTSTCNWCLRNRRSSSVVGAPPPPRLRPTAGDTASARGRRPRGTGPAATESAYRAARIRGPGRSGIAPVGPAASRVAAAASYRRAATLRGPALGPVLPPLIEPPLTRAGTRAPAACSGLQQVTGVSVARGEQAPASATQPATLTCAATLARGARRVCLALEEHTQRRARRKRESRQLSPSDTLLS